MIRVVEWSLSSLSVFRISSCSLFIAVKVWGVGSGAIQRMVVPWTQLNFPLEAFLTLIRGSGGGSGPPGGGGGGSDPPGGFSRSCFGGWGGRTLRGTLGGGLLTCLVCRSIDHLVDVMALAWPGSTEIDWWWARGLVQEEEGEEGGGGARMMIFLFLHFSSSSWWQQWQWVKKKKKRKEKERKRESKEKRGKVVCDAIIVGGGHMWIKCSDISGREGMECDCGGVRTLPVHLGGHPPLMLEVFAPLSPFSLPPSFSSLFSNFSFESSPRKMSSTDSRKKRMLKWENRKKI